MIFLLLLLLLFLSFIGIHCTISIFLKNLIYEFGDAPPTPPPNELEIIAFWENLVLKRAQTFFFLLLSISPGVIILTKNWVLHLKTPSIILLIFK